MSHRDGALYEGKSLRDEVLYLHGLWHQGPHCSSTANYNNCTNPKPYLNHLRPRSSIKYIKDRNHHRQRKKVVISEKEWPCDPAADANPEASTGWPDPQPKPAPRPPSAEELAAALASRAQKNGVEACKSFFLNTDIDGDPEEGDEADDFEEAFKLFMEVFTKENELRKYYEENNEKGEFLCLVCEGSGAKRWKTYGDCTGLVQHCNNVDKTRWRAAHRGLAKVLCRVVGWNFDRLPMLILDFEETLGQKLARDAP